MEQLRCKNRSCRSTAQSCRRIQLPGVPVPRHALLLLYAFIAYTAESSKVFILGETLCGGELVDTLQFVCGDRGFYFEKNMGRSNRRVSRGIVEECCFRSCDLDLLETYCAKPVKNERDLSTAPATALPSLNKDVYHKHAHTKHSKYDIWQRKPTQSHRLRRGVPAIVLARQYRRWVRQIEESQQFLSHRPLTTSPMTRLRSNQQDSESSHN
ncbi:PREDICTED: insulin-like growth factor II isoform X2 [Nanorana parkeri]|uniref:insulin-like growth factor II isoform X2 n=1 Tax=Nanorana parkeri TaxID=125878 RepID=UPI0008546150|nr:PREDICTED: insulin-like growth factor II isoform X2 [Nanorana parkeri]